MAAKLLHFILALLLTVEPALARTYSLPMNVRSSLASMQSRLVEVGPSFGRNYAGLRSRLTSAKVQTATKEWLANIKSTAPRMAVQGSKLGAQGFSHNFQTVLTIFLASIVISYQEEQAAAKQTGIEASLDKSVLDAIDNFELIAALIGGGTVGAFLSMPLKAITKLLTNEFTRPIFRKILLSGASALVVFVSFEFFSHLWQAAILQLDKDEIKIAENLKVSRVFSGKADYREQEIFAKTWQIAYTIVTFADPELGEALVYDTWRLTLATGEFSTLLVTMVTSGIIAGEVGAYAGTFVASPLLGTAIGWIAGLFGGVIGAVVAHNLPQEIKIPITHAFRGARSKSAEMRAHVNENEIRRILSYYSRPGGPHVPEYSLKDLKYYLTSRSQLRGHYMTAQFENVHLHYYRSLQLRAPLLAVERVHGKKSDRLKELSSVTDPQIADAKNELKLIADRVIEFYITEVATLKNFSESRNLPSDIKSELDKNLELANIQLQFLVSLLSLFKPEILNDENIMVVEPSPEVFEKYMNGIYLFAYREHAIVELLLQPEAS